MVKVEITMSNNSNCYHCHNRINFRKIRIEFCSFFFHLHCIPKTVRTHSLFHQFTSEIHGMKKLSQSQRLLVDNTLCPQYPQFNQIKFMWKNDICRCLTSFEVQYDKTMRRDELQCLLAKKMTNILTCGYCRQSKEQKLFIYIPMHLKNLISTFVIW